jgi:lysyl-tRNA synthetase class 2
MNIVEISFNSHIINLDKEFNKVSFIDELNNVLECEFLNLDKKELIAVSKKKDISLDDSLSYGKIVDKLFGELVEPNLINPTFVLDYPKLISPLAKQKRDSDLEIVERFELFIGGDEFANSFSELNDPLDQRVRLENQVKLREEGDEEAQPIDDNFIEAMECGMPPTGGVGLGVDRLVMLLTDNRSIRDVLLFPAMRNN